MTGKLAMTVLSSALVLAAAAPAAHAAGAVNMNPGKWEVTVSMEMEGMPAGAMQPHATTECIKPKDANTDWLTKKGQQDKDCKTTLVKQEPSRLSWTFECASGSSGDADFTFGGDSYDGTMHIKAQEHAITQKIKARRVGDC